MENLKVKGAFNNYGPEVPGQSHPPAMVALPSGPPKPKLLDQVRQAIRTRHYSDRTEKAYVHWIKRFIFFHHVRHPCGNGRDRNC